MLPSLLLLNDDCLANVALQLIETSTPTYDDEDDKPTEAMNKMRVLTEQVKNKKVEPSESTKRMHEMIVENPKPSNTEGGGGFLEMFGLAGGRRRRRRKSRRKKRRKSRKSRRKRRKRTKKKRRRKSRRSRRRRR